MDGGGKGRKEKGSTAISKIVTLLLLSLSMHFDEPVITYHTCALTPFVVVPVMDIDNEVVGHTAGITALAFYSEIMDDLKDEIGYTHKLKGFIFKSLAEKVKKYYPSLHHIIMLRLKEYNAAEHNCNEYYDIQDRFEAIFSCIALTLMPNHISWDAQRSFEQISCLLGRWVWLIDALDDYEDDISSGKFNPLKLKEAPDIHATIRNLNKDIDLISSLINSLPINRYKPLIITICVETLRNETARIANKYGYS